MKCLLWETSGVPWGVGVAEISASNVALRDYTEDYGMRTLAADFISAADRVLQSSNCVLRDIGALVVSLGPGSWTGLRIGLTAAKTLSLSFNTHLIGIPTFDAMAAALARPQDEGKLLLVQSPCRPGERYAKLWYCRGVERELLKDEWIATPTQIANSLKEAGVAQNARHVVAGTPDGRIKDPSELGLPADALGNDITVEWRESTFALRLEALGKLASVRAQALQWDDALTLQPIYLAPSAAEREFYAKQQSAQQ